MAKTSLSQAQFQGLSWFKKTGMPDDPTLVGQVYFPTNSATLDTRDRKALRRMAAYYAEVLRGSYTNVVRPLQLLFTGFADHRGTESHNQKLGEQRAQAVQREVDRLLATYANYSSTVQSQGETHDQAQRTKAGAHKALRHFQPILVAPSLAVGRRVDIRTSYQVPPPKLEIGDIHIFGEPPVDTSNRFIFRITGGFGIGEYVGGQSLQLDITNERSGQTATYMYVGAGGTVGFPISITTAGEEEHVTLPHWVLLEDFQGAGNVIGGGLGYTGTMLYFDGPMDRGEMYRSLEVVLTGTDIGGGFQADRFGYWNLMHIKKKRK